MARGRLGDGISLDLGRDCARQCALNVLDVIDAECGLEAVEQLLKITVFVASEPSFAEQPRVADAASEAFVGALGERGEHARSAVGVSALPLGAPVEIEAMLAINTGR